MNGELRRLWCPCRRRAEEAKQQEEEEAKKREEEEAAAAAAALAGVSLEAETVTSERDASRVPAGTDDTELEDSLLGSSIDVRATSSVAQVRLSMRGQ
jgi:sRNA-binding protein